MRTIVLIALMMIALGGVATRVEVAAPSRPLEANRSVHWVHTVDGWEDANSWRHLRDIWTPTLHPAVVASLQLIFSVFGLVAFSKQPPRRAFKATRVPATARRKSTSVR